MFGFVYVFRMYLEKRREEEERDERGVLALVLGREWVM